MKVLDQDAKVGRPRRLQVVYQPIGELKPDPKNSRLHSKKQIRQIANSIKTFDFNVPILVDRYGNVIAGHGRLLACRELGMTEVPTLCLEHLTEAQIRAFMIADNRLTEIASWDDQLLAEQLQELSLLDLDFDIEVTGFEMGEIDLRIASLEDEAEPGDDPADILPEPPARPPISKCGDLWHLGHHHVLCGNALDRADFAALMGEERAVSVFTDPPYNVPIDGHASGLGSIHHRPFPMASGEMDSAEFTAFLGRVCLNLAAFSTEGSLHYICMDWRHLGELLAAGRDAYGEAEKPLRLDQGQWWNGLAVPQPARARPCLQTRRQRASQQCPAWPVWPQPQQCLALSRGQFLFPPRRGRQSPSAPPNR